MLYYFELSKDKKPSGKTIPAKQKLDYITRTGKYKNLNAEEHLNHDKFHDGGIISSPTKNEKIPPEEIMLYDSPYGKIKLDENGNICVSKDASIETIDVALSVAKNIFGDELHLSGPKKFIASAIISSKEMDLPIRFDDEMANSILEREKEEERHEREQDNTKFFGERASRRNQKNRKPSPLQIAMLEPSEGEYAAPRQLDTVPGLSELHVAGQPSGTAMLVQPDERDDMDILRAGQRTDNLRWSVGRARRRRAESSAGLIVKNLEIESENLEAFRHVQYINREAAFKKRGDRIYTAHHLPKWAKDDPKRFFAAADKYEGKNSVRYKEIKMGLPNYLPFEEQKALLEEFINRNFSNYYYCYAIHSKKGNMSEFNELNTHAHFMFSAREIDDIEREKERPAKVFFKKYHRSDPSKGGPRKNDCWVNKYPGRIKVQELRKDWANTVNKYLEKNGFSTRVDHRKFDEQRKEAQENGNETLAQILAKVPEKHIDLISVLRNDESVRKIKKLRAKRRELDKNTYKKALLDRIINEEETSRIESEIEQALAEKGKLLERFSAEEIKSFERQFNELRTEKTSYTWIEGATKKAYKLYLTEEENHQLESFQALAENYRYWNEFMESLNDKNAKVDGKTRQDLQKEIAIRLQELHEKIVESSLIVRSIHDRISQEPLQKNIYEERESILANEEKAKRELQAKLTALLEKIATKPGTELKRSPTEQYEKEKQEKPQGTPYTAEEIVKIKEREYELMHEEYARIAAKVSEMEKKVISKSRAIYIAKDRYTNGELKAIRQAEKQLRKERAALATAKAKFDAEYIRFISIPKPTFRSSMAEKEAYQNTENKMLARRNALNEKEKDIVLLAMDIEERKAIANKKINTPEAKAKIEEIALGILRKNEPISKEYEALKKQMEALGKALGIKQDKISAVKKQARNDRGRYSYKVKPIANIQAMASNSTYNYRDDPTTIMDAIFGNKEATNLTMRTRNDDDGMNNWAMMSEMAKDEIRYSLKNLDRW